MTFSVTIPGTPVSKQRPRFTRHGGVYTPKATKAQERRARVYMLQARAGRAMLRGPLTIVARFAFKRPKKCKPDAIPGGQRDADNLVKLLLDAAQGVWFENDKTVVSILASKEWGGPPSSYIQAQEATP